MTGKANSNENVRVKIKKFIESHNVTLQTSGILTVVLC